MANPNTRYLPVFSTIVRFGDSSDDLSRQSPMRVRLFLPEPVVDPSTIDADAIRNAPPPVMQVTRMHLNSHHSPNLHDQAITRAAFDSPESLDPYDDSIQRVRGELFNQAQMMIKDNKSVLSPPSITGAINDYVESDSLPEFMQSQSKEAVYQNVRTPATDFSRQTMRLVGSGFTDPLAYYHMARSGTELSQKFTDSYAQAPGDTTREKVVHAIDESVVQPLVDRAYELYELDARNREYLKSMGDNAGVLRALSQYRNRWSGEPELVTVEPYKTATMAVQKEYLHDNKLVEFDPDEHPHYVGVYAEGHAGSEGQHCLIDPNHDTDSGIVQGLNLLGITMDKNNLQKGQAQVRQSDQGQTPILRADGVIEPENLGLETYKNGLRVVEPGIYGDPSKDEPDFRLRSLQGDGMASISSQDEPCKIVCFPHPKLDIQLEITPAKNTPEDILRLLHSDDFRSVLLEKASEHIEPDFPELADQISANCCWSDVATEKMKDYQGFYSYNDIQLKIYAGTSDVTIKDNGVFPEHSYGTMTFR